MIILQPLTPVNDVLLLTLRDKIVSEININVVISNLKLRIPQSIFNPFRGQYYADGVIKYLNSVFKSRYGKVLGIIDGDGYVPHLNFVFGEAELGGNYGVIFLERLKEEFYGRPPSFKLFLLRALKEALHEIGHLYGLSHCSNPRCVMYFSNSLMDTDYKEARYCDKCRRTLKLNIRI